MHADGFADRCTGFPIRSATGSSTTACRRAGWSPGSWTSAIVLLIGVPLAAVVRADDPRVRLRDLPADRRRRRLPLPHATLAGGSATWGMRFTGIELRRGDGTRFDFATALLHTALYTVCISVVVLQVDQLPHHPRHALPPEPRRHASSAPTAINRPAD